MPFIPQNPDYPGLTLTEADFEAADRVVPDNPIPETTADTRLRLATVHHALKNPSSWSLIEITREQVRMAKTLGLVSKDEANQIVRELLKQNLTEEILASRFNELQAEIEVYCELLIECSQELENWHAGPGEHFLERRIDDLCDRLSKKSSFYTEELKYLSEFIADARVHQHAGPAQIKSETAASVSDIVLIVVGKLRMHWDRWLQESQPTSLKAVCKAFVDVLPRPQDLSTMLEYEHAMARSYLRERQAKVAAPQSLFAGKVNFAVHANTIAIDTVSNKTADDSVPIPIAPIVEVSRWSELAIGINEHGCWAFIPVPDFGERVLKKESHELKLPGKRWNTLLNILATSSDGQTASRSELITTLGWMPAVKGLAKDGRARPDELVTAMSEENLRKAGGLLKKYRNLLSDLRRELGKLVAVPKGANPCLRAEGNVIKSGFYVATLINDGAGHYRFGDPKSH